MPAASFQPILDAALADYTKQIGIDPVKHPFVDQLRSCHSPDDVLMLLEGKAKEFKDFRDGNRKLINCLKPVVTVVQAFSGILGEVVSVVPFQPAGVIFAGLDILIATASGVSASYDALVELFECIGNFLKRLRIYADLPLSPSMTDIIVKIMVELLSVLALATKQTKQGRFKKFAKKLLGEGEIEAVLQRLDRLTQEEGRMTMAQTLEVVHGLMNNVKVVMNDGKASMDGIWRALDMMQQMATDINKMRRDQLQKDSRSWLSPPDPSQNYNIACEIHQNGTATWFIQGSVFTEWNAKGSLLWIYGKPGSGKSILTSSIIREVDRMCKAGLASMAYFYFDFRDTQKQSRRGLLSSLLSQFSAESDPCYHILSQLYSANAGGTRQPSEKALSDCLIEMLEVEGQPATYIIIDALDECPNTSGMRTEREKVLDLLKQLVDLQLPNVHICLSSRPEFDIQDFLEPLAPVWVALDNETGQKADILEYITSVVHSHQKMRKWSADDKQLVISTLSDKADGMFRWVYCQLEVLRRCFPQSIRGTLEGLPKTLDATYEHTLLGIDEEKWEFAHRLFQCLAVSVTPLRVEDLAQIMAFQFDEGVHPHFNTGWQQDDAEEAVLSACSSLITITSVNGSRIVQFAHFSVKEFLISDRFAGASENLSRYHIVPHMAHTTLAQVSLGVLLQLDDHTDKESIGDFPFSSYAARHWFDHCQFGDVSSIVQDATKCLFNREKPHFSAWVWIYDIDDPWRESMPTKHPEQPIASPLYYAILCGFRWLIEHLIVTHPEDVNARGGCNGTPLLAAINSLLLRALSSESVGVVQLLLEHDVDVNLPSEVGHTPLHRASRRGNVEVSRLLVQWGADVHARDKAHWTALQTASQTGHLDVARFLIDSGADVNTQDDRGWTPLHRASRQGYINVSELLIQHGADVNKQDEDQETPLHVVSRGGNVEISRLLVQGGADVEARDKNDGTPLYTASLFGHLDVARFLIDSGAADAQSRTMLGWAPLHTATLHGHLDIVQFLIDSGVDVNSQGDEGWIPLHLASLQRDVKMVQLLIQRGADVEKMTNDQENPLHLAVSVSPSLEISQLLVQGGADAHAWNNGTLLQAASLHGHLDIARFLINRGVDVNSHDNVGWTALHSATGQGHTNVVELLIQHGADVNRQTDDQETPLYLASARGNLEISQLLVQKGADLYSRSNVDFIPLQIASMCGHPDVVQFLIDSGVDVNLRDNKGWTPSHLAANKGHLDVVKLLLERGADFFSIRNDSDRTPFDLAFDNGHSEVTDFLSGHMTGSILLDGAANTTPSTISPQSSPPNVSHPPAKRGEDAVTSFDEQPSLYTASENGQLDIVRSLLDRGSDANERDGYRTTALAAASMQGRLEVAKLLIERGAQVDSRDRSGMTPLLKAVGEGQLEIAQLLLEIARLLLDNGADVNAQMRNHETALHLASRNGEIDMAQLLLERGANVHVQNEDGETPRQLAQRMGCRRVAELLSGFEEHGRVTK